MSLANQTQTSASTLFIDLATFSELESFTYGGKDAVTLFVASVQKANWFSFVPITLRHTSGTPTFGAQNVTASVNRSGDYVLNVWFRAQIPLIGLRAGNAYNTDAGVAWTNNLMHNLIAKCNIAFNELVVQEFDNYYLDVLRAYKLNASKRIGYDNMIGQVNSMTQLHGNPTSTNLSYKGAVGDGSYRSVPLPFWFCEDSGVALPVAALPFNDVKITYTFRPFRELIVVSGGTTGGTYYPTVSDVVKYDDAVTPGTAAPELVDPQTFAHYAVVHNDERVKMGDAPRDVLITQVQIGQSYAVTDVTRRTVIDVRFSHSIIALFFMIENTSLVNFSSGQLGREGSNYTTQSALACIEPSTAPSLTAPILGSDPILYTQLLYENTPRYSMSADYYMWISPYYFAEAIPKETGYHMISYSLKTFSADPMGSTNYGKLSNVSIVHDFSNDCKNAAADAPKGYDNNGNADNSLTICSAAVRPAFKQNFRAITLAINRNVARIANGSLGHPSL
jgi:hypothetical protein